MTSAQKVRSWRARIEMRKQRFEIDFPVASRDVPGGTAIADGLKDATQLSVLKMRYNGIGEKGTIFC